MTEEDKTGGAVPDAEGNKVNQDAANVAMKMNEEMKELKEKLETAEADKAAKDEQIRLYQANQTQPPTPVQKQATDFLSGLDPDDIPTNAEMKRSLQEGLTKLAVGVKQELVEIEMKKDPDYGELITKHFDNVAKKSPELKALVNGPLSNFQKYHYAKADPEYQKKKMQNTMSEEAKLAEKNLQKPGNLDSVSAGKGGTGVKNWMEVSEDEFLEKKNKLLGG